MTPYERDQHFMQHALGLAHQAADAGEVPIGCVLVNNAGNIIGQGYNQPVRLCDPTAHAEIIALRQACMVLKNYRLDKNITAYVTLQPCLMCAGAFLHARIGRLVIAAQDTRGHSLHRSVNLYNGQYGNHSIRVEQGPCQCEAELILSQFFKERR